MAWHLTELTPEAAEGHDRRVYNAQPPVRLGWRPYTFRATKDAVSQFACLGERMLEVQLKRRGLKIEGWSEWHEGVRTTRLVPR